MLLAVLVATGAIVSSLAALSANLVIIVKLLRLHENVTAVQATVNGRMDQLLHEARKSAALEAIEPAEVEVAP